MLKILDDTKKELRKNCEVVETPLNQEDENTM